MVSSSGTITGPEGTHAMYIAGYYYLFGTHNVVMTNGSYAGNLAIYDSNGNLVASTNVNYYVSGNEAHASNPDELGTWIENHSESGDSFKISGNFPYSVTNPDASQAQVTATAYVNNQPASSGTATFTINQVEGGCGSRFGGVHYCPPGLGH